MEFATHERDALVEDSAELDDARRSGGASHDVFDWTLYVDSVSSGDSSDRRSRRSWADASESIWPENIDSASGSKDEPPVVDQLHESGPEPPKNLQVQLNEHGLPTFDNRLPNVPEFFCKAPLWMEDQSPAPATAPAEPGSDSEQDDATQPQRKTRSQNRRRYRQITEKWKGMNALNTIVSRPVVESARELLEAVGTSAHQQPTQPRSLESSGAPWPSPRKLQCAWPEGYLTKRSKESGALEPARDPSTTKVSL